MILCFYYFPKKCLSSAVEKLHKETFRRFSEASLIIFINPLFKFKLIHIIILSAFFKILVI